MLNKKKKFVIIFIPLLFLLLGAVIFIKTETSPVNINDHSLKPFEIKNGESLGVIAQNLKDSNLIRNRNLFILFVRLSNLADKLQAGNYEISPNLSPLEISKLLTHGTADIWVTLPEGWRKEEIAEELNKKLSIDKTEFLRLSKEGYLFPDTYRFQKGAPANTVVNILLANFEQKATPFVSEGIKKGLTEQEILTLASMIEREAKIDADRPIIAGILFKRLKNNWPLEVDATVQYALGFDSKEKTWWKKNLYQEDLKIASPYNTRANPGLPPGPISNPGVASIKAVVNPQDSPYWFYLSDNTGLMHYSKTLEEHNLQVQKYLR